MRGWSSGECISIHPQSFTSEQSVAGKARANIHGSFEIQINGTFLEGRTGMPPQRFREERALRNSPHRTPSARPLSSTALYVRLKYPEHIKLWQSDEKLVLPDRIELSASPLPILEKLSVAPRFAGDKDPRASSVLDWTFCTRWRGSNQALHHHSTLQIGHIDLLERDDRAVAGGKLGVVFQQ
jgi:hypothetical protein